MLKSARKTEKDTSNHRLSITFSQVFVLFCFMVPITKEAETINEEWNLATITWIFPSLISPSLGPAIPELTISEDFVLQETSPG